MEQYGYELKEQSDPIIRNVVITNYANYYPTVANIELTNKCNVRCKHCYGEYSIRNNELISFENICNVIESLNEIGISILELTGGDPTMYPYISDVIEKALEVGISAIMILTNGIYFSEKLLKTIINNKERIYIQIDLHSLNEQYYDWFTGSKDNLCKVKNNIDLLIGKGVRVRVCAIFTPGNVHELKEIGEWAFKHGAITAWSPNTG